MRRRFIYYILIFLSLMIINPSSIFCYGWNTEFVDNQTYTGDTPSIKIDSNNHIHISYALYGNGRNLKYAYFDGSKWNTEFVDIENCGKYSSIAIDSKGNIHISYCRAGDTNYVDALKYAYFDGTKWNIQVIDTGPDTGQYTSIALDSKDHSHISYCDKYNGNLKYAYFDGTKWNVETLDSDGDTGWATSIAIDSKDHIYISYHDETNMALKIAYWTGTGWKIGVIDGCMRSTSIDIDKNDRPHIAYRGVYNGWAVKYAYWDGNKWVINIVDSEYIWGSLSLALDSKDRPHISYVYGKDYSEKLKYAYFDGNNWHITVIDKDNNGGFAGTSIDFDSNDYPHIAYDYFPNLKHAWYEGPYPGIDLTLFTAKPGSDAITLNWTITTDEDISGFNLYRRIVPPGAIHELPLQCSPVGEGSESPANTTATVDEDTHPRTDVDSPWTKVNTSLITGTNPYSYTDRDVFPETSYEYKLEAVVSDRNETLGTTSVNSGKGTPESFDIARIYPTPADSQISIDVIIPEQTDIEITIYDITGRKVATVTSGLYNSGEYTISGDVTGLKNGVYIVRMTADSGCVSKNFVVAR